MTGSPPCPLPNPAPEYRGRESHAHASTEQFAFQYDGVLGTSLDLLVRGCSLSEAHHAAQAALCEIKRLSAMLSTRNPSSEISALMSSDRYQRCSPEIGALLDCYQSWSDRTGGIVCGQLAALQTVWRQAELQQLLPSRGAIDAALAWVCQPASVRNSRGEIRCIRPGVLNIDALGKAFIIDRALASATRVVPPAAALLLNVGGDIAVRGGPWTVAIADPLNPADNALPLARVTLNNRAIATSAHYERCFTIGGQKFSHLLDPRTGWPARDILSSTAIAVDAVTANALAIAFCILGPDVQSNLLARSDQAVLRVDSAGTIHRLGALADVELRLPPHRDRGFANSSVGWVCPPTETTAFRSKRWASPPTLQAALRLSAAAVGENVPPPSFRALADGATAAWPAGYQVSIDLTLKSHSGQRAHRPYVAVWIEDSKHKPVRTIAVWGPDPKYQRDLSRWSKAAPSDPGVVAGVTRATRRPGKYTLVWDGLDDAGKPAPAGQYTVWVEVNREHGGHVTLSAPIACADADAKVNADATAETDNLLITYGKKGER